MEVSLSIVAATTAAVLVLGAIVYYRGRSRLPPGPPGFPIVRNIFDIPKEFQWLVYADWAKKYGPIVSFRVLGKTYIVLDSAHDVREILVRRGKLCARRTRYVMYEQAGLGDDVHAIGPEGHRTMKQFAARTLGRNVRQQYADAVDAEVAACIRRILMHPGTVDPHAHLRRTTGGLILRIVYGYEVESDDDKLVRLSEQAMLIMFTLSSPGWLIDSFPWMRYLPEWLLGTEYMRVVPRAREIIRAIRTTPVAWAKEQIAAGTAKPSLVADLLSSPEQENDIVIHALLADFYAAGTDTTLSALLTLFLMLALYPAVQAKARAEVDSVTQGERRPKYSDYERLPYVAALAKELYRFPGVLNIGFPHRLTQELEYKGYILPENAVIYPNIWSILHDPIKYPEPFKFDPERYLGDEKNGIDSDDIINQDPSRYVFGFEPRACLGRHFVDQTLFMFAATLVATCEVSDAVNERGEPISPTNISYTGGFVSQPRPYKCKVRPRQNAEIFLSDHQTV